MPESALAEPSLPPDEGPSSTPARIGRYEVIRSIGRGATGQVLLARDPVLDREVALKYLRPDLRLGAEERESLSRRMRQEAKASARVSHPHIVGLFDMSEDPKLGVVLVFEHAEGTTLKARLTRGPLSPTSAANLALELGDALTTAHRAGVLHRDVKPENIILTKTGAKIADFGVARVPESTLTKGGGLLGTPAYSAPESVTHGEHSAASDQFSLAATLYEAISGHRAFPGDDAVGVATRIQTEEPLPIAASLGLDPAVDAALSRALHKSAARRFSSCAEMGHALAEALSPGDRPSRAPLATVPDSRRRRPSEGDFGSTRPVRIALGGAVVGVLVTLLALRIASELTETTATPRPTTSPRGAWLSPAPSDATAAPTDIAAPTNTAPPSAPARGAARRSQAAP
ncbi:MAG: protein kinase [Myxococcales bacterium]|jgi:serine/threonine protein kinase|nr:protein kinase [Myxococcales bacterium]